MKWMSELLMPVSRSRPSKLRDAGLIRLAQGGYGIWNPNDERLMLLPMGTEMCKWAVEALIDSLEACKPQMIDTCGSQRGGLDVAVRAVKRAGDLPLLLAEKEGSRLKLLGLTTDAEAAFDMSNEALRSIGSGICSLGVKLRRVDRMTPQGHAVDLLCLSGEPLGGEEGLSCGSCGWLAAYDSPCRLAEPPEKEDPEELREAATPNCKTIAELCAFLKIEPSRTVKTMFYAVEGAGLAAVILRGDRQVCLEKVRAALQGAAVRHADPAELAAVMGDSAGYMGPVGLPASVRLIADYSVVDMVNAVVGANKAGYHRTGACWGRDFSTQDVADVTLLQESDRCPTCGAALSVSQLRPVARFMPIDPACAAEKSLTYFSGQSKLPVAAWSASIDLTALLAAVIEKADVYPEEIAPFCILVLWDGEDTPPVLAPLLSALDDTDHSVVVDDRRTPIADRLLEADVMGVPQRIYLRRDGDGWMLDIKEGGHTSTMTLEQYKAALE